MNSKEALKEYKEIYIDKTFKGNACPSQEWYLEIIKQDLDRLEQLEDNIKIHKETIKMQHNQIESLQSEIESLKTDYNAYQNLSVEVRTLFQISNKKITSENAKLKKVIEILREKPVILYYTKFECWKYDERENLYSYSREEYDYDGYIESVFTYTYKKEEFDLLKEYLGND